MRRAFSGAFVGRDGELEALAAGYVMAQEGQPSTVLIGGEAGVGKSRLVREFSARAARLLKTGGRQPTPSVLVGGCVELGAEGLPFAPFTAALRPVVRERGADGVSALLHRAAPGELARLLPSLGCPAACTDADAARARLFEEILALLEGLTEDVPVVLVVEDAHWADRSSRDLLDFLVRNQQAVPRLLIVVTYRSEALHRSHPLRSLLAELDRLDGVQRWELPRLVRREVTAQIAGLLGRRPEAELVEMVYRRSEGNPLFVESLLHAGDSPDLPESLRDLLLARIGRLPEPTRALVRAAGAGCVRVRHALLAAVVGLDDVALSEALRPAVDANVLVVDRDEYVFRHALIRDAAHSDLLPGERTRLHVAYAEALERDPTLASAGRPAAAVAHHWYAAGQPGRAIVAAWHAAAEARACLAYAEQVRMLDRVLRLWERVPDAADRIGADNAAVLEQAAEAAHRAGEHERAEALATAALTRIDADRERVRAALLLDQRARIRRHLGRDGDVADHREAVRLVPRDHPARAVVLAGLASRLMEVSLADEAHAAAEEALAIARRTGDDHSEAASLITLAAIDARHGDLAGQLPRLAQARATAARTGAHGLLMQALRWESSLLQGYGKDQQAAQAARCGLIAAEKAGLARTYGAAHAVNLVSALIPPGEWDAALEIIEDILELASPPAYRAHLLCLRGGIALARGDLGPAEEGILAAHELAAGGHFAQDVLLLPQLETELRLAQGRLTDATTIIERTLAKVDLRPIARFSWPLLTIAARVADALRSERNADAPGLLDRLTAQARTLPTIGPVQQAHRHTFLAEAGYATGEHNRAAWDTAATAWDELGHPYRLARALLRAAETTITGEGDRDAAIPRLRRAADLAGRLNAGPLRQHIERLARRARIALDQDGGEPPGDPVEQTRRKLGLSSRELEVLRLIAAGRSNREIAQELFISPKTASVHVSHILAKLGVSARVEAAAAAFRLGLFDDSLT